MVAALSSISPRSSGRCVLLVRDPFEQLDEHSIRSTSLSVEAGTGVTEVAALEGRVLADLPGEEALPERTERHEADAQLFEGRQERVLVLTPPERILTLKRCHGLDGVRASDCLRSTAARRSLTMPFSLGKGGKLELMPMHPSPIADTSRFCPSVASASPFLLHGDANTG